MCSELGVAIGGVGVGVPCTGQDCPDLHPGLQTLLAKRQPLQLLQTIPISGTVYQCVFEERDPSWLIPYGALLSTGAVGVFQLPGVLTFVVKEFGVVVALVEVLEDAGEDFGDLGGEGDPVGVGFEEVAAGDGSEEGRGGESVGVGGEEAFRGADGEGYDWGGEVALVVRGLVVSGWSWTYFADEGLGGCRSDRLEKDAWEAWWAAAT